MSTSLVLSFCLALLDRAAAGRPSLEKRLNTIRVPNSFPIISNWDINIDTIFSSSLRSSGPSFIKARRINLLKSPCRLLFLLKPMFHDLRIFLDIRNLVKTFRALSP